MQVSPSGRGWLLDPRCPHTGRGDAGSFTLSLLCPLPHFLRHLRGLPAISPGILTRWHSEALTVRLPAPEQKQINNKHAFCSAMTTSKRQPAGDSRCVGWSCVLKSVFSGVARSC